MKIFAKSNQKQIDEIENNFKEHTGEEFYYSDKDLHKLLDIVPISTEALSYLDHWIRNYKTMYKSLTNSSNLQNALKQLMNHPNYVNETDILIKFFNDNQDKDIAYNKMISLDPRLLSPKLISVIISMHPYFNSYLDQYIDTEKYRDLVLNLTFLKNCSFPQGLLDFLNKYIDRYKDDENAILSNFENTLAQTLNFLAMNKNCPHLLLQKMYKFCQSDRKIWMKETIIDTIKENPSFPPAKYILNAIHDANKKIGNI